MTDGWWPAWDACVPQRVFFTGLSRQTRGSTLGPRAQGAMVAGSRPAHMRGYSASGYGKLESQSSNVYGILVAWYPNYFAYFTYTITKHILFSGVVPDRCKQGFKISSDDDIVFVQVERWMERGYGGRPTSHSRRRKIGFRTRQASQPILASPPGESLCQVSSIKFGNSIFISKLSQHNK